MNDLERYIKKRKESDPEFAKEYEIGYTEFKIGVILRRAREEVGLTQEELAPPNSCEFGYEALC